MLRSQPGVKWRHEECEAMTGAFVSSFVLDSRWGIAQGFDRYFDDLQIQFPIDCLEKLGCLAAIDLSRMRTRAMSALD